MLIGIDAPETPFQVILSNPSTKAGLADDPTALASAANLIVSNFGANCVTNRLPRDPLGVAPPPG